MKLKILFYTLLSVTVFAQEYCKTPTLSDGVCIQFGDCAELVALFNNKNRLPNETELIRNSLCGRTETGKPKVCCKVYDQCLTPDLYNGMCTGLNNCPSAKAMIKSSIPPPYIINYIRSASCQGPEKYSLCCSWRPPCVSHVKQPHPNVTNLLPNSCDTTLTDRIVGGTKCSIDQFPWTALIEYEQSGNIHWACGGSIISSRYVLTAAHCLTGNILKNNRKPVNVRLSEYDTDNIGKDCEKINDKDIDCNEGTVIIPIQKIIVHPCYEEKHYHDIGLLRLKHDIIFTDFIKPICLPNYDITLGKKSSDFLMTVIGWGTTEKGSTSNIKLYADIPYMDLQSCQKGYGKSALLIDKQLCAGGISGKDSCRGDSGGPLIYTENKNKEILVGIVSFGPSPCGRPGVPGVYTNVWKYLDWIMGEIQP